MKLKEIYKNAEANGSLNNKDTMWKSVEHVDELLEALKESHPEIYWKFMREEYGFMNDYHYNDEYARYDVENMSSGEDGETKGEHWSVSQVDDATSEMEFPEGTTKWDKYVAFNAVWHDMHSDFKDDDILKIGYLFFFDDDDWKGDGKIWKYMCLSNES